MSVQRIIVRKKAEYSETLAYRQSVVYDVEGLTGEQLLAAAEGILFVSATDEYRFVDSTEEFNSLLMPHYKFYALKKGSV